MPLCVYTPACAPACAPVCASVCTPMCAPACMCVHLCVHLHACVCLGGGSVYRHALCTTSPDHGGWVGGWVVVKSGPPEGQLALHPACPEEGDQEQTRGLRGPAGGIWGKEMRVGVGLVQGESHSQSRDVRRRWVGCRVVNLLALQVCKLLPGSLTLRPHGAPL